MAEPARKINPANISQNGIQNVQTFQGGKAANDEVGRGAANDPFIGTVGARDTSDRFRNTGALGQRALQNRFASPLNKQNKAQAKQLVANVLQQQKSKQGPERPSDFYKKQVTRLKKKRPDERFSRDQQLPAANGTTQKNGVQNTQIEQRKPRAEMGDAPEDLRKKQAANDTSTDRQGTKPTDTPDGKVADRFAREQSLQAQTKKPRTDQQKDSRFATTDTPGGRVGKRFAEEQSVSAQATQKKDRDRQERRDRSAQAADNHESNTRQSARRRAASIQNRRQNRGIVAKAANDPAGAVLNATRKTLGAFAKWTFIFIAAVFYAVILVFGILAAIGLIGAMWEEDSITGTVVGSTIKLTGYSFAELFAYSWGITIIFAFIGFGLLYVMYRGFGINPNETTFRSLATNFSFLLSLVPVLQIFPWIILWVVYINISSMLIVRAAVGAVKGTVGGVAKGVTAPVRAPLSQLRQRRPRRNSRTDMQEAA